MTVSPGKGILEILVHVVVKLSEEGKGTIPPQSSKSSLCGQSRQTERRIPLAGVVFDSATACTHGAMVLVSSFSLAYHKTNAKYNTTYCQKNHTQVTFALRGE